MTNISCKKTAAKRKTILIWLACFIMFVPVSCSKYQDGPIISFRAKEKRLAGTWIHSAFVYIDQNLTVTDNLPDTRYTFTEDGKYFTSIGDTGTWDFGQDVNLNIKININGTDSLKTFEILRLASKKLWLKTNGQEWHFVPE